MLNILRNYSAWSTARLITQTSGLWILAAVLSGPGVCYAGDLDDPLMLALAAREVRVSVQELETMAGGSDALVKRLLELRTQEKPPFVGIRAEKLLLLNYSDRAEVASALASDVGSPQYAGLARLVAANIDQVPNESARRMLAKQVLARAKTDSAFAPYAKNLAQSADGEVAALAKQTLE
ncbi:MAG TPA: hypothetical protein PLP17_07890 [Oligoflexia bacterium]|nr:hypothetical protein [Oligoflexia bacterium]